MPKFKGRDLRIKVRTSTGPDVFTVVGGARSDGITINNETVDVTDKDGADDWSNKDDNGLEAFVNLHVGSQKEGTKEIRGLIGYKGR